MKRLICAKDVEDAASKGEKVIYVESGAIITPSAGDVAKNCGIEISVKSSDFDKNDSGEEKPSQLKKICGDDGIDSEIIYKLIKVLKDKGLLGEMINLLSNKPYVCETDGSGLKLVRGNSVKMDVFDTGNPSAKVFYQELISKDDASMSAGFLTIDHSTFDWKLTYEEIDYVIEGTLTITINGKIFTAHPGDIVCVPSGSKVIWGSPDKVKLFYVTYPANWADLVS